MAKKSAFEIAVIDQVRKVRIRLGHSQDDLAMFLDVSRGFIGQVESPADESKYNLDHLNRLAFEMKCSPKEFIPDDAIDE